MPKIKQKFGKGVTFAFEVGLHTKKEVKRMQDVGYVELPAFKAAANGGYSCNSCIWFKDGDYCNKYDFAAKDFGCCGGWEPDDNKKL